jgi:GTP-binding protein HflX
MENKLYETEEKPERLILISVDTDGEYDAESCIDELEELVKTAGAETVGKMIQKREGIHRATYFGKGKMEELKAYIDETQATGVVCDDELTSNQIRNMEKILGIRVMNRTLVILDIFAKRAMSAEGKAQVELAQLRYNKSHLTGFGKELSRQGGGIGTRGPGEKKLETDRRNIDERISELNKYIKDIEKHRQVIREKRTKNSLPVIALAGYTNAGKSTLMNTLTDAGVLAEDKLFATLDTTTRRIGLPSGADYLFTDTVGFIQKLPHNLVQSFKATLEEVKYADLIVHIVDISNPNRDAQMKTVYRTFAELGCENKPVLTVFNKIDKEGIQRPFPIDKISLGSVEISAKKGIGTDEMLLKIEEIIKSFKKTLCVVIPYDKSGIINRIFGSCEIIKQEYTEDGTYIELYANEEMQMKLKEFEIENR